MEGKPSAKGNLCAGILLLLLVLIPMVPMDAGAKKVEQKSPEHVFLWAVKSPGCTAYLLGSIHMLSRGSYPLDARVEKAYASCSKVVFEADVDEAGTEKVQKAMLRRGTYPKGQSIRKNLSAKTYVELQEKCKSLSLDGSRFDQVKPWLVSVILASINLKQLGYSPQDGIDAYFLRKAGIDDKKTIFLESAGNQINLVAQTLSGKQEELLKQTLEELDVVRQNSSDLEKAWRRGDAVRVEEITRMSLKGYPEIEKKLFTERNAAWVSKIDKLLFEKEDVFIIVGAAHLVGNNGVLELLTQKGYDPVQE
jgi:uncharacterized protein